MNRSLWLACTLLTALSFHALRAEDPVDGRFPPPKAPEGNWDYLFTGSLQSRWTGMSMAIDSPIISTAPNADHPNEYVLQIQRGPTGLIRSIRPYENFILEYEFRHLTEAPSANGGPNTSGNSGLLIAHSAFPAFGGPYPREGHEIQVCNLGNGSWYTSHGDTFTLPGTDSFAIPDPRFAISHECGHRSMPIAFHGSPTGEWNRIRITCVDGVIQNEVNGHLASSLYRATPRKGYISFESEGAPVEFRNMRIQELEPDPDLLPRHIAPLLPEPMTTDYITERKPLTLPQDRFLLLVDLPQEDSLRRLLTGPNVPDLKIKGRILVTGSEKSIRIELADQPAIEIETAPTVLHLESGRYGHILLFRPISKG